MDTSYRLFVQSCVILLLCVEFSLTDDFDVTTIYKFYDSSPTIQAAHSSLLPSSLEIHARNNARGLPFLSKEGTTLEPNVAVDIQTCTSFDEGCNWKLSNFSHIMLKSPLKLQGKTEAYATETIKDGEESQLQLFQDELTFTFYSPQSRGTLRIYLMDSPEGLSEANMYYITMSNDYYHFYYKFYRCSEEYKHESLITIAPKYGQRQCKLISQNPVQYYNNNNWHSRIQFFVKIKQKEVSLTTTSAGDRRTLIQWNDDFPLKVQYYKIGTTGIPGSITRNFGPDELPCMVLTHGTGSIVSETFTPRYSEVCVSVVYHRETEGSIALQIVKEDGEKLHLKQLQTSSLGGGWESSIYKAQLPEEKSHSSIRIELTAEAPRTHNIAIQRIAGCNSEGLEDIYVVPLNNTVLEMPLYAYDVAVSRSASDSKVKLECLNGGQYDNERTSCICPAGFKGKTCELGCGPDRYDSKCSGRCSRTGKGCQKMKLCRPKLGCNCAPGFTGDFCNSTCSSGRYGANCEQMCGNCINESCDIYTGLCPSGCQEGFYPPYCKTYYKHLSTHPKVISIDYHTLQLTFSIKPEDLRGSGTPIFYQIQIRDENQFNTWTELEPISLSAAQTVETNITQLKPGTNYQVRVIVLDIDGNSYQGKDVPIAKGFTECIVPKVDYNLTAVKVGQKEFQIEWEYSAESTLWCRLTHFEVEMNVDWTWKQHYKGDDKTFTFLDLLPGEKYKVRVRGVSVNGPLLFSQPLAVTTQDEAPRVVLTPSIVSRTQNQIEVSWEEPLAPRGRIQKYKVTYKCQKLLACKEEDCSFSADYVEVRKTSVTLQGLMPHAQYLISIAAMSGLYGPEVEILATTDMAEPEVSPGPAASTIVFCTNSTLTVQWERPKNCTHLNGYLYGYQYEFFEPKNPNPLYEGSTEGTTATFTGLNPHTEYKVKVYLKTSAGRSLGQPLIINASTRATVPGKVEQLTVYKVGRRIIGLRWGLPKETYGDIKSFTISYRSEHQKVKSFTVMPTPCIAWPDLYCHTISSLHADTEYTLTVQAKNKEVNEDGAISQVVATTKENAPLAPDYIKTVSQTETSLTIEWGLPNLINGVLRSFLVNIEETDSVNNTDCCQYFPIQEVAVKYEQANYQIQLNSLKPASTYAISVTAKTMALGPPVSITAHTRPPVPSIDGILELVDSGNSSNLTMSDRPTLHIHLPSVNKDLLAGYLLVVIPESANLSVQDTPISNEWLAQQLEQQINATFYVAAELNQDEWENDPAEIILGKGSSITNGKWSLLWDPVLENEQQYRIGLVVILDYCGVLNIGYTVTDTLTVIY